MAAFDSTAYLNNKVAQLNKTGQGGRNNWTVADAQKAISDAGLSLQDHYQQYGKNEGVSATGSSSRPQMVNPTFDTDTYLKNKTAQLNQTGQGGRNNWTVEEAQKAIADSGMDLQSHYQRYGAAEGVLPYAEAKMKQQGLLAPQSTVTANQTSQGQLHQMLDSNSPLMKQAATMGGQRANARGLLNSSMASEAAQGAMISAATPFAQQDASTYFQNSQANTDRQQQEYMTNLNYQNQRGLNEQNFGFQSSLSDQQYQQNLGLNQQGYQFDMGRMRQQFNQEMDRMGYAYELDQRNIPQNYAANISATTLQNIQSIQADPNLQPEAKKAAVKNVIDMANANMSWAEAFYNTPMPGMSMPGGSA
ncbi:MAG: hypothetical protein CME80_08505 [Halomonas sp.]|nr:hypothetical protein [Halomonas sp.]MBF57745.1 hypothetical protein [Halomonas sp.]|tara:strand:+ start:37267 stop:38352 length:1086 start_codon:yes stop_codon:yes gene_type:complete